MNTPFTLRQLEVFTAIVKAESLTRACSHLNLSQSAASMALRELEQALEGPLFQRVSRKLVLNDRGRLLLPKALEILRLAEDARFLLTRREKDFAGKIILGCSSTIASYRMPPLLKRFHDNYPKVEIMLRSGNTREICEELRRGHIDLGFVEGSIPFEDIEETPWLVDELTVICPPDHPHGNGGKIHLEALIDEQWILRESGSGTRTSIEETFTSAGLKLRRSMELGHTEAIKRAVENGLGISCLSRIAVERELEQGYLKTIPTHTVFRRGFRKISLKGEKQGSLVHFVEQALYELTQEP